MKSGTLYTRKPVGLLLAVLLVCICKMARSEDRALPGKRSAAWHAAAESISRKQLAEHVERLADERFEGRAAGSRGARAAAEYVATQFARVKLRPAGHDGSYWQPFTPNFRNVLAAVDGNDPRLKHRPVVVGAHYDHVGYGDRRSSRGPIGFVHPGADDNASGVAALLELAQACQLLDPPPRRTVLFAALDAEEIGLLGAKHLAAHPPEGCQQPVAMINLDMVGRLRENRLAVYGTRTAHGWRRFVAERNKQTDLRIDFSWTVADDADHYPFFARGVSVLMFHTGLHDEYHTPADRPEKLDYDGLERIARLVFAVVYDLAQQDNTPPFRSAAASENEQARRAFEKPPPGQRQRLGVRWDETPAVPHSVILKHVAAGSAADRAGLRPGDQIIRIAGREIHSSEDLIGAVQMAPNRTTAVVLRPGQDQPLAIDLELDGPPLRLGITWRTDEAEPGTAVLVDVVPGTPAARAGLKPGDRIYAVAGRSFADDAEMTEILRGRPMPLPLTIEREGQLRTVVLRRLPNDGERSD